MADTTVTTQPLSLPEKLIPMLLNGQDGYFHRVPGRDLNCAVVGAVLAELSLRTRTVSLWRRSGWTRHGLRVRGTRRVESGNVSRTKGNCEERIGDRESSRAF